MFEDMLKLVCKVLSDQAGTEVKPDHTLDDVGFGSLEVVEAMLNLEEAFPEADIDVYEPTTTTTVLEIAQNIFEKSVGK